MLIIHDPTLRCHDPWRWRLFVVRLPIGWWWHVIHRDVTVLGVRRGFVVIPGPLLDRAFHNIRCCPNWTWLGLDVLTRIV
jgi:hypothetical protein